MDSTQQLIAALMGVLQKFQNPTPATTTSVPPAAVPPAPVPPLMPTTAPAVTVMRTAPQVAAQVARPGAPAYPPSLLSIDTRSATLAHPLAAPPSLPVSYTHLTLPTILRV